MRQSFESCGAVVALALALAAQDAWAQDAGAQDLGCFPKCRSGYVCHEGACVSLCNPPCADDERCTPEGECVSRQGAAPPEVIVAPPPAPSPTPAPAPPPPPPPPREPNGGAIGFTVGAATCASGNEYACNTADGDAGLTLSLRGGYRFLPWLIGDAEISATPLFFKGVDGVNLLATAGLGARFLPFARRGRVDPVLALRVGYAMAYAEGDGESIVYSMTHGLVLSYGAGVDFNLSPLFSLGLMLDVLEPFWLSACTRFPPVEYDVASGTGGTAEHTSCRDYEGGYDRFLFVAGVSGSFLL